MSQEPSTNLRSGFCIYINTFCQGPVPVVSDDDVYVVFKTELEAQKEIVDNQMLRLKQFLDGERDYADAITVEEYVVPVTVHPDGVITDKGGIVSAQTWSKATANLRSSALISVNQRFRTPCVLCVLSRQIESVFIPPSQTSARQAVSIRGLRHELH